MRFSSIVSNKPCSRTGIYPKLNLCTFIRPPTDALVQLDRQAMLNNQLKDLQSTAFVTRDGRSIMFRCYLTADGKGMQAMHSMVGCRCWVCQIKLTG